LDARMASMRSAAMEFGTVPGFHATLDEGKNIYVRIPKLLFPTEQTSKHLSVTPCMQDITLYNRQSIYAAVMRWFDNPNGPAASGEFAEFGAIANKFNGSSINLSHKGKKWDGSALDEPVNISDLVTIVDLTEEYHTCSWGLQWKPGSGFLNGHFPEYFQNGKAVAASSVPKGLSNSTWATAPFPPPDPNVSTPYVSPTSGAWTTPGPVPGRPTQTVTLDDRSGHRSKVTYAWYRFVDQPALQNLGLSPEQKNQLQSRIELLHKNWNTHGKYMKPPSKGSLVSMDPKLIVEPPDGLKAGYVPIVIKQERA
jgi:hypothetical protein